MKIRKLHLKCVANQPNEFSRFAYYHVYPGFRGTLASDSTHRLYSGFGATVAEAYADFWRINKKFNLPHFQRLRKKNQVKNVLCVILAGCLMLATASCTTTRPQPAPNFSYKAHDAGPSDPRTRHKEPKASRIR